MNVSDPANKWPETTTRGTSLLEHINAPKPGKPVRLVAPESVVHEFSYAGAYQASDPASQLPEAVRRVAELAPGKQVTVIVNAKRYDLPHQPPPAAALPPDPLLELSQRLLERDLETRAAVAAIAARSDAGISAVKDLVSAVAAGQEQVAESVKELSGTLHLPVKPVYDKAGKLIGAKRVAKLGV